MNITAFKASLRPHADLPVRFILPDGGAIPAEAHVTEAGHVTKRFIDCGGTRRSQETCLLQVWVSERDQSHRLFAGKLGGIMEKARAIVPSETLQMEVEYGPSVVAQYTVTHVAAEHGELRVTLGNKATDCLARELCEVSPATTSCGCAQTAGSCC